MNTTLPNIDGTRCKLGARSVARTALHLWERPSQCLLYCLLLFGGDIFAQDSTAVLQEFSDKLSSFSASFEQTVYDAESEPMQSSTGTASLLRPGMFTWHYKKPNEQQIVADGSRVWIYDPDLEQVTVSALDERASGTPLALLMGGSPLTDEFDLKALGESDSIIWFELTPKSKENDFEKIFIGLNDTGLAVMELRDNFGQATQIKFADFKANIPLDEAQFKFVPPEGVDVIGGG